MLLTDPVVSGGTRLVFEEAWSHPQASAFAAWTADIAALVSAGQADGSIRSDLPAGDLAKVLIGTFSGLHQVSGFVTGRRDLPETLETYFAILKTGLRH